jgi:hypothetical protein
MNNNQVGTEPRPLQRINMSQQKSAPGYICKCGHEKRFHITYKGYECCLRGKTSGIQNKISCNCKKFEVKMSKVIRLNEELIIKLQEINKDINLAVTDLLQIVTLWKK